MSQICDIFMLRIFPILQYLDGPDIQHAFHTQRRLTWSSDADDQTSFIVCNFKEMTIKKAHSVGKLLFI